MPEDRRINPNPPLGEKTLLMAKADHIYQMAVESNDAATAMEALKMLWELSK